VELATLCAAEQADAPDMLVSLFDVPIGELEALVEREHRYRFGMVRLIRAVDRSGAAAVRALGEAGPAEGPGQGGGDEPAVGVHQAAAAPGSGPEAVV
jgi:hypothetical protein